MKTTPDLLQRIQTMPLRRFERDQIVQAYVAADAIVEMSFRVAGWIGRAFARKTPPTLTPAH